MTAIKCFQCASSKQLSSTQNAKCHDRYAHPRYLADLVFAFVSCDPGALVVVVVVAVAALAPTHSASTSTAASAIVVVTSVAVAVLTKKKKKKKTKRTKQKWATIGSMQSGTWRLPMRGCMQTPAAIQTQIALHYPWFATATGFPRHAAVCVSGSKDCAMSMVCGAIGFPNVDGVA